MHDTETASAVGLPWRENECGDYAAACSRCELVVTMTQPDHAAVCDALSDYDKRLGGTLGRALVRDVAVDGVVLREGDCLETCVAVPDTGVVDAVVNFASAGIVC